MTARTQKKPRFVLVAETIYRYVKTGGYYERLRINGRNTWRALQSPTLTAAKEEVAARRADLARSKLGLAENPYVKVSPKRVAEILEFYAGKGFPNAKGKSRSARTTLDEKRRLARLHDWWGKYLVHEVSYKLASDYGKARMSSRGGRTFGGRAVDLDLWTLDNALRCALRFGLIPSNPLGGNRPIFGQDAARVRCRERMPASADELHRLAAALFENPRSEALGWQLLIEALTGLRTSEVLSLRIDATRREEPGYIQNLFLFVHRLKGGINPYALVHEALAECIRAHRAWLALRWPKSPWWIPSILDNGERHADIGALGHALKRVTKALKLPHRTSHGLRAYYVTVRRAQGVTDGAIAAEIGDRTGASIIADTYGAIPPGWRGEGDHMDWRPKDSPPAWQKWL